MLRPIVLQPEEFGKAAPLIWDAHKRGELAIDPGHWLSPLYVYWNENRAGDRAAFLDLLDQAGIRYTVE